MKLSSGIVKTVELECEKEEHKIQIEVILRWTPPIEERRSFARSDSDPTVLSKSIPPNLERSSNDPREELKTSRSTPIPRTNALLASLDPDVYSAKIEAIKEALAELNQEGTGNSSDPAALNPSLVTSSDSESLSSQFEAFHVASEIKRESHNIFGDIKPTPFQSESHSLEVHETDGFTSLLNVRLLYLTGASNVFIGDEI